VEDRASAAEPTAKQPASTTDKAPPVAGAPVLKALPAETPAGTPAAGVPVLKAIPVEPPQATPAEVRKAVPVGPLDEESDESLLNKAATPPPAKHDE
jgi:hypothetical protein